MHNRIKSRDLKTNKQFALWIVVLTFFSIIDIFRHLMSSESYLQIALRWTVFTFLNSFTLLLLTYIFYKLFCDFFLAKIAQKSLIISCLIFLIGFNIGLWCYQFYGPLYIDLLGIGKQLTFNQSMVPHLIITPLIIFIWLLINFKLVRNGSNNES